MFPFEEVWQYLQKNLSPGTRVANWTALKGYLGDKMTIVEVGEKSISIEAPRARSLVVVPRGDFERVWEVWRAYRAHRLRRSELTEITFYSKYVISILRWYEAEALKR